MLITGPGITGGQGPRIMSKTKKKKKKPKKPNKEKKKRALLFII